MSSSKEIACRWFTEFWNGRNPALASLLMASDCKGHLEGGIEIVGPGEFLEYQKPLLEALPDVQFTILNSLADQDDACVFWQAQAREGRILFRGTTWMRIIDGKIVEGWDCWDRGNLLATLASL